MGGTIFGSTSKVNTSLFLYNPKHLIMKKQIFYPLIASLTLSLAASTAHGVLIAKESFLDDGTTAGCYVNGQMTTGNNATVIVGNSGFSTENAWQNGTGSINVVGTSFSSTHLPSAALQGSMRVTSYANNALARNSSRQLATTPTLSATYYMSGLISFSNGSLLNDGDHVCVGFQGNDLSYNETSYSSGISYGLSRLEGLTYLSVFAGGNIYNLLDVTGTESSVTYQVVIQLTVDSSGNDILTVGYADDSDESLVIALSGTSVETWSGASSLSYLTAQAVTTGTSASSNVPTYFDEVYLGTDLSDVTTFTSIPEASTYSWLVGVFVLAFVYRRFRR